ncbi:MAG: hypothetical protein E7465_07345 [Ruminococcaceae bacterium]|nr:hypothetical protein [Oscillospiraceae bacterium]
MEYIASISYGKDSLAMLEVISDHNMPLDRIVHVEIMATTDIPADLPEVTEWKHYADNIIYRRYGIIVEHVSAGRSYEDLFYSIPCRKEQNIDKQGQIRGFPSLQSQWCSSSLKSEVMKKIFKRGKSVQYIGIAANEPKRFSQLNDHLRSPLVEHGVTEEDCYQICEQIGLLAPTYLQSKRSGCWFCHAQPIDQLRLLRAQHPLLWAKLLEWDQASPIPFRHGKRHGNHSVTDFDERFSFEDRGILAPNDHRFKWAKMEEYRQFHQLSIEEFQSHDK